MRWRYKELIAALGGPAEVEKKISALGFVAPDKNAIRGWAYRNCVPGWWVPVILSIAIKEEMLVSVDQFIRASRRAK